MSALTFGYANDVKALFTIEHNESLDDAIKRQTSDLLALTEEQRTYLLRTATEEVAEVLRAFYAGYQARQDEERTAKKLSYQQ